MRKFLIFLSMISLFFVYGCGGELTFDNGGGNEKQDANMTAVDFDNIATLTGTYQVVFARVACSNGVTVESTDVLTTEFESFYAFDGIYSYYELVFEYGGAMVLDEGEKVLGPISFAEYVTTVTQTGPYNFRINYDNVPVGSGVTCSERFDLMKLSDNIRSQYFRVLVGTAVTDFGKEADKQQPYIPVFKNIF